jgi:hypothetical protein
VIVDVKLDTPLVRVTLNDGRTLTAQVTNPDYLRWDRTAAKHGWQAMSKIPFTWLTFVAWSALRRTGALDESATWEEFSEHLCVQVASIGGEEANGKVPDDLAALVGILDDPQAEAVPTPPGPEPG